VTGKGRTSFGGQALEGVIRAIKLVGFIECSARELNAANNDMFRKDHRILVSNMPYKTIFGTPGRREYFLQSPEWSGELECKFQNAGGSVDEKMVYVAETLKRTPLDRLALVYGGAYWTKQKRGQAVIQWLRDEALAINHTCQKELLVMTLDEFIAWAGRIWKHD